ncbi:MAG: type II toxin-antitoxin system prevent-host-death family antitoxin [Terricaulis sp.]
MREVGLFEAKNKLSELVEAAAAGEEIVITKHGRRLARLGPAVVIHDLTKVEAALKALDERASKRGRFSAGELRAWINEGRK